MPHCSIGFPFPGEIAGPTDPSDTVSSMSCVVLIKRVPFSAVCLPSFPSAYAFATQEVGALGHRFHMQRMHAEGITAEMVEDHGVRDDPNQRLVRPSMCGHSSVAPSPETERSIPFVVCDSGPHPARAKVGAGRRYWTVHDLLPKAFGLVPHATVMLRPGTGPRTESASGMLMVRDDGLAAFADKHPDRRGSLLRAPRRAEPLSVVIAGKGRTAAFTSKLIDSHAVPPPVRRGVVRSAAMCQAPSRSAYFTPIGPPDPPVVSD